MARTRKLTPTYSLHKASGRGRLTWTDPLGIRHERLLPGTFNSPESLAAKSRLELEIVTSPTGAVDGEKYRISVAEVFAAYLGHAERYYVDAEGKQTSEVENLRDAIKPARELYGETAAVEFGPRALAAVRQHMIGQKWCRTMINRNCDRIRRAFRWAASEELVPASVYESLRTLPGLRRGRTNAKESKPVKPVADEVVDATLPHLPRHVRVMIELLRYTGMRPAEVCSMTLNQIERGGAVWTYNPTHHKTAHHGKRRVVPLGPHARAVLSAFLAGQVLEPDEPIFSPRRAREERFAEMRRNRRTKVQPSQLSRKNPRATGRMPSLHYHPHAIAHAVAVATTKAFPPPSPLAQLVGETSKEWQARLTDEQKQQLREWQSTQRWHPYQLRHSFATRVRREHGLEAAQVLLGHSRADVTQVYAERNESLAVSVAASVG